MKPKIEKGVWETIGNFRAHVTEVAEELSWGCFPGIEDGRQVCWSSVTLKAHDPAKPEWNLAHRIGDLPNEDNDDFIFESSKPKHEQGEFEVRATQWTITPKGKPIFDERATTLKIEDEAGGEFLVLENCGDCGNENGFRFDVEDWPPLRALIDEAIKGVKK